MTIVSHVSTFKVCYNVVASFFRLVFPSSVTRQTSSIGKLGPCIHRKQLITNKYINSSEMLLKIMIMMLYGGVKEYELCGADDIVDSGAVSF